MKKMGFIGCGNMGGAIIRSVAPSGLWDVLVYDLQTDLAKAIAKETGADYRNFDDLMIQSDIVVLAVKPQILPELYKKLSSYNDKMYISMAAGIDLDTLARKLGTVSVSRIMPNIAAAVKKAVTAVAVHQDAEEELSGIVMTFAETFGSAHELPEKYFSAFIGASGSAIATAFEFLHGIAMGGVHEGLPYTTALGLICDTVESATALVRETKRHPQELLTQVCSPGGLTVKTMQVLYENGFAGTLMESVEAASQGAIAMEEKNKN
jgi:pyrroline-5-carboxylate reductase